MPYARFDLDLRHDPRWADVPRPLRAAAKAVLYDAIMYSAEMLADGRVPASVMEAIADECGLDQSRKSGRVRGRCALVLVDSGFLERDRSGGFTIVEWRRFHDSREEVQERRKREADKKRRQRGQLQMPDVPLTVPEGRPAAVPEGQEGGLVRARAHASSSKELQDQEPALELQPPTTARANGQTTLEPAAAATEPNPPREHRIRELAERYGADPNVIYPAASTLTATALETVATTLAQRLASGHGRITNPAGLLVELIRDQQKQAARAAAQTAQATRPASFADELAATAHWYATSNTPRDAALELLTHAVRKRNLTDDERERILDHAAAAYDDAAQARNGPTPSPPAQ